jgi:hypothetical protein
MQTIAVKPAARTKPSLTSAVQVGNPRLEIEFHIFRKIQRRPAGDHNGPQIRHGLTRAEQTGSARP